MQAVVDEWDDFWPCLLLRYDAQQRAPPEAEPHEADPHEAGCAETLQLLGVGYEETVNSVPTVTQG